MAASERSTKPTIRELFRDRRQKRRQRAAERAKRLGPADQPFDLASRGRLHQPERTFQRPIGRPTVGDIRDEQSELAGTTIGERPWRSHGLTAASAAVLRSGPRRSRSAERLRPACAGPRSAAGSAGTLDPPLLNDVIGDLLPSAFAVALSPIPIVAVVLVLGAPTARTAGPAFALGWIGGLLPVSIIRIRRTAPIPSGRRTLRRRPSYSSAARARAA